ncbi:DUF533 domain-containing protein [Roseivivax halodurans]|nr:DUF533 domain-containing protein [Roseivivax halodurans]
MSMKRILGTMLASRMAGRGRRRGALGSASALGMLGSRRRRSSGLGGKLGLAALGYMAYQAYQSSQSSTAQSQAGHRSGTTTGGSAAGSGTASGSVGSIVDKIRDTANEFLSGGSQSSHSSAQNGEAAPEDLREGEEAAERFSEDEALLMIRAMITAAYADGSLSDAERSRILDAIGEADATPEERATMEREIANPRPLDVLLPGVKDKETAEEFYLVSRAAVDGDSEGDRRYLADLRQRLDLTEEEAAEADSIAA